MLKSFLAILLSFVAFFPFTFGLPQAYAQIPVFPSCLNPQGSVKVSYDNGVHGIVGDSGEYKGKDTVYTLNNEQLVQCFCAEDGSGIQTNWLKVGQLPDSQKKTYENEGWIYIPNGKLWGLEESAYIAKNLTYSCKSSGSTQGVSASSDGRGGAVVSDILGLASTGNTPALFTFSTVGSILILMGFALRKNNK